MTTTLQEFRKANEQRAEAQRNEKVIEYHKLMGDVPAKAKAELLELHRVIPEAKKIIAASAKKYPPGKNDQPVLGKAIADFNDMIRVAREICETRALRIQQVLDRIESARPESFQFYDFRVLADEDRRILCPLLTGSDFLKNLSADLTRREPEILHLIEVFAKKNYTPPRSATVSPPEPNEDEPPHWDARVS